VGVSAVLALRRSSCVRIRCALAISAMRQTGHSDAIESPEAMRNYCRQADDSGSSISVVWTVTHNRSYAPFPCRPGGDGGGQRLFRIVEFALCLGESCGAAASAATESLERCMGDLRGLWPEHINANRASLVMRCGGQC
jgi:hypothetical protein